MAGKIPAQQPQAGGFCVPLYCRSVIHRQDQPRMGGVFPSGAGLSKCSSPPPELRVHDLQLALRLDQQVRVDSQAIDGPLPQFSVTRPNPRAVLRLLGRVHLWPPC
jgi:hypothetical protein